MTIDPSWVVAGVAFVAAGILGVILWATRRKQVAASDAAGELAERNRASARREAAADLAAAKAAGTAAIAETDARVEREIADAVSTGSLSDTFNSWPRDS